jgi:hypothetical protein
LTAGVSLSQEGQSVALTLVGSSTALATVAGDTASYREVLAGTDLSYVSRSDGVEEVATLESSEAPTALRYRMSTSGLTPRAEPGGSIVLLDEAGTVLFWLPAPVAYQEAVVALARTHFP